MRTLSTARFSTTILSAPLLVLSTCLLTPLAIAEELPEASSGSVIEEILVTAQRREEDIQDVPIAISAFSSAELQALDIRNLQDLTEFVPGVEVFDERGAGMPVWVIRGVGLTDFNSNNSPAAGIYYDDFYLVSNVMGGIGMYDTAQVEVLKGPQGGLYGRNTTGGAVRVNSVRPSTDNHTGYINARYGSWSRYGFEGAFGGPITDKVGFRLAGMIDQGGGWQDSLTTEIDDKHGDRDFYSIRAQLDFEPHEELSINIKLDAGEDNSETILGRGFGMQDPVNLIPFCEALLQGRRDDSNCLTWTNATLAFVTGDPGLLPDVQSANGEVVLSNPISQLDNDWMGLNVTVNRHFESATLISITGYIDYRNKQLFDFDGGPLVFGHEDGDAQIEAWSQEFRLVSSHEGPWSWMAGMSYSEDTNDEFRTFLLQDNLVIADQIGPSGDRGFKQETESWAAYGQASYDFNEYWRLHASLRYTSETRDLSDAFVLLGGFPLYQEVSKRYELDEPLAGHIGVDWGISDNAMIYAKLTRAYKSGGFFGGFAFDPAELDPYIEETVWAYEAGFKSTFLDNSLRLNGAVFFYDYQDAQGFVVKEQPATGTDLVKLGNVGDAEHIGFDLDAAWAPAAVPGLRLSAGISYVDAEITDSDQNATTSEGIVGSLEGLSRPGPRWSYAIQGRYEFMVSDTLNANVQVNYSETDDHRRPDMLPPGAQVDVAIQQQDGVGLLNARIGVGSADGRWELSLTGRNLTDEVQTVNVFGDSLGSYSDAFGLPRRWTLELAYSL